jgi:Trypsin-like peptidase domain
MRRTGKSARVPWAFLFTLTAFLCSGLLSSAAAQSVAGTVWLSEKKIHGSFSTITFAADGQYSEIWNKKRPQGRWQASADNQQITVTVTDGPVLHFAYTADKNLIRSRGHEVYKPTTVAAAAAASRADETDSSPHAVATPPVPDRAPTVALTAEQARAVVLISGDNGQGTGFLVKTKDGPAIITNQHVIANNPNLKITTSTGVAIAPVSYSGATDRDLARIAIKDAGYSYLPLAPDVTAVSTGDEVITPGNSQGGQVMLNTDGKVLGIGPDRVEVDNPIYHGNSGGPIFDVKTGQVIGVVTEGLKVDNTDELDKASFSSRNSAIRGAMRYFGMRVDNVPQWEAFEWRAFQAETAFLDKFDQRSRSLFSYLSLDSSNDNKGSSDSEDADLWQQDTVLTKANSDFKNQTSGDEDTAQKLDALRELYGNVVEAAKADVNTIQNENNFYSYDRQRAKDELAYRQELLKYLDSLGDNVDRLGHLPRTNN